MRGHPDWLAKGNNNFSDTPYIEGFVAVLQIAIADLAGTDLCLLPTFVDLDITVEDINHIRAKEVPDNSKLRFEIAVPRLYDRNGGSVDQMQDEVLATATMILIWCSALPEEKVTAIIRSAYKSGLSAKAFLVRPYSELYREFASSDNFNSRRSADGGSIDMQGFSLRENEQLRWRDGPGIGYSKSKAKEFLKNRYTRGLKPIRKTLKRLRASTTFQQWVSEKRAEGLLDWQILLIIANTATNIRLGPLTEAFESARTKQQALDAMNKEETDEMPSDFENRITGPDGKMATGLLTISASRTWGLRSRHTTPDFLAWTKLLDVRYFQNSDDIPHEDLFSPI